MVAYPMKLTYKLSAIATTIAAISSIATEAQAQALIQIDGSSTVFPITEAVAEEFQEDYEERTGEEVRVTVGISGTGGGFRKFCAGETDISDASRPIKESEIEACAENGIEFIEIPVAFDALTVVVHPDNPLNSLTFEQLNQMWAPEAEGAITNWNQVDGIDIDAPLALYGPGADSGTFDYFTETINGDSGESRGDFTASEDDNVLVQGVAGDPNALGYFGFAYYLENEGRIKGLAIDGGDGPVRPSPETVNDETYPLSRPIFIYVRADAADRPEVEAFVNYYLNEGLQYVSEVGYVPLPDERYADARDRFEERETGTEY